MNLIEGYKKFYQKHFVVQPAIYKELAEKGQNPATLVIACSDSRVDPATLTSAHAGEIFVVRNVANLVAAYDDLVHNRSIAAALEFSVVNLQVSHIVVKGHADCGGIRALIEEEISKDYPLVAEWMKVNQPVIDEEIAKESDEPVQARCEKASIVNSLNNLRTYPFIAQAEKEGKLKLHGWYFCLNSGQLYDYKEDKKTFESII